MKVVRVRCTAEDMEASRRFRFPNINDREGRILSISGCGGEDLVDLDFIGPDSPSFLYD